MSAAHATEQSHTRRSVSKRQTIKQNQLGTPAECLCLLVNDSEVEHLWQDTAGDCNARAFVVRWPLRGRACFVVPSATRERASRPRSTVPQWGNDPESAEGVELGTARP